MERKTTQLKHIDWWAETEWHFKTSFRMYGQPDCHHVISLSTEIYVFSIYNIVPKNSLICWNGEVVGRLRSVSVESELK